MVPVFALATDKLKFILLGYVIERICDIVKLPLARYFDRKVHNVTGVLMDDIIAGLYAAGILSVILYLTE